MTIGDRLKELFDNKGVTPYQVAKETGISESTLSRIIKNSISKLNIENSRKLAEYFHVNETWLATGNGDRERKPEAGENSSQLYLDFSAIVDSNNRMARAMEKMVENSGTLTDSNRELTSTNARLTEKAITVLDKLLETMVKIEQRIDKKGGTEGAGSVAPMEARG